ncbi:MAG: enolase C-terminal domain-like protein [Marivibrio sp.]|uniref:enolase C-terminal domain-like protein n=1 Tax=Marivibrio sp. TaxID=2039719 RepID=UPI0032EF7A14
MAAIIARLTVRPVIVPMPQPLMTGAGLVKDVPLALIDVERTDGIVGSCYLFCYTPPALAPTCRMLAEFGELIAGQPADPLDVERMLQAKLKLLGAAGIAGMALAGIDMALWDAAAKAAGLPLCRLLGGAPKPIRAYNSNGLGLIGPDKVGPEAARLLAQDGKGFRGVKLRLGYADPRDDLAAFRAAREAAGEAELPIDYNQALSVGEAVQRITALEALDETRAGLGPQWAEEPIRADDYAGYAALRRRVTTPIQLGENCWGPHDVARAVEAEATDFMMPDAMKIYGTTGWLRAAALAEAAGLPVSTHLFPEVSAHLMAVTPTAHRLEYVDWAESILTEGLRIEDGLAHPSETPGTGIAWDEAAVRRYGV